MGRPRSLESYNQPDEDAGPELDKEDREQLILLLQQGLEDYDFDEIASRLADQSGIREEPQLVNLKNLVLDGDYDSAAKLLPSISSDNLTCRKAQYEILHQKFMEQIECGDMEKALQTLKDGIQPLNLYPLFTEKLAGLFLFDLNSYNSEEEDNNSTIKPNRSREELLQKISDILPERLFLPPGRMDILLARAQQMQGILQSGHNVPHSEISLLREYEVGTEQLPTRLHKRVEAHKDEIWLIAFSNDGQFLASASKDKTVAIHKVEPNGDIEFVTLLEAHKLEVTHVMWQNDDSHLLTCCRNEVRLWDVWEGFQNVAQIYNPREQVTAIAWGPAETFYIATTDKKLAEHNLNGSTMKKWQMKDRVSDLVIACDGRVIISGVGDHCVEFLRYEDHVTVVSIGGEGQLPVGVHRHNRDLNAAITSINITKDEEFLCTSLKNHRCQMWRIGPILRQMLKKETANGEFASTPYGLPADEEGDEQISRSAILEYRSAESTDGKYVIRASLGGMNEAFLASGSEGGKVYIWHRETGELLVRNDGHTAMVNCVAWNSKYPHMLASASDDRTIAIWVSPYSLGQREYIPIEEALPQNRHLKNLKEEVLAQRGSLARTKPGKSELQSNLFCNLEQQRY